MPLTHVVNLFDMDSKYGDVMDVDEVLAALERIPASGIAPDEAPPAGHLRPSRARPRAFRSSRVAIAVAAPALAQEKVLRVRIGSDMTALDPAKLFNIENQTVSNHIFNGLVRHEYEKSGGMSCPDLAEKWELSADGKTYTFRLRKGVKWHKGYGELTADDVKFSYDLRPRRARPRRADRGRVRAGRGHRGGRSAHRAHPAQGEVPRLPQQQGRGLQPGLRGEPQGDGEARGTSSPPSRSAPDPVRLRRAGRPGTRSSSSRTRSTAWARPSWTGSSSGSIRLRRPPPRSRRCPAPGRSTSSTPCRTREANSAEPLQGAGHHRPPTSAPRTDTINMILNATYEPLGKPLRPPPRLPTRWT